MNRTSALSADVLSSLPREDKLAVLRARMEAVTGTPLKVPDGSRDILKTLSALDKLVPCGGLVRGTLNHISDTPLLLAELIASATRAGYYVAVVGWPEFSYAEVFDTGGDFSHIIVVADPGRNPLSVTAALADGVDLVIHYQNGFRHLADTFARPLRAKVHQGTAAVLFINLSVPTPAADISAQVTTYRGIGAGSGRITGVDLLVTVRTQHGRRQGTITIGTPAQLCAV